METAILTKKLKKCFKMGKVEAVIDLDLNVKVGEVYGFLGRNGSGKTTTINMLMGLLRQNSGEAYVFGCPSKNLTGDILEKVGFVSEGIVMPNMKVGKLIKLVAGFYPTWEEKYCSELLADFKLPLDIKVKALSHGMNLKLKLLLALAYRPKLLILDEPFSGIDAVAKQDFMDHLIKTLDEIKTTVFFSSHQIEDVERLADRIGIIEKGRLSLESSVEEVKSSFRKISCVVESETQVPNNKDIIFSKNENNRVSLIVSKNLEETLASLKSLGAADIEVSGMDLREIFIAYERFLDKKEVKQ